MNIKLYTDKESDNMLEKINKLCTQYNFRYDIIDQYIRIYSNRDTWYFIDKDYRPYEKIKLLHANNSRGAGTHQQKGEFRDLNEIFRYIDKHDKRELLKRDKVCRIAEKLKILYAK
jgi:hypothetical protein